MTTVYTSLLAFTIGVAVFVIHFNLWWVISGKKLRRHFHQFTLSQKADWCSRMNSTLHAIVVVPAFAICAALVKWKSDFEPHDYQDLVYIRAFMAFSVAYFTVDLFVILVYRVPMWLVFVAHHIIAIIPLSINVFYADCPWGTYVLSLFLLVELPTLSLNFQVFLEQTGHAQTRSYAVFFYITYVTWILCRLALPVYLLYVFWDHTYGEVNNVGCKITGVFGGHAIALFCFVVFFFVLTKELRERWRNTTSVTDLADIKPGIGDHISVVSTGLQSPTNTGLSEGSSVSEDEHVVLPSREHLTAALTQEDLEWGLGIERPPSVMRHGASVMR
eukprot:PhM_4_TR5423/c0_g2_i1/m.65337